MEIKTFRHGASLVEAVQVTMENLEEVAKWAGADWFCLGVGDRAEKSCVKVNAWSHPGHMAYIGEWVHRDVKTGDFSVSGDYFTEEYEIIEN